MKNKLFLSVFLLFASTALYEEPAFENLSNDNQPEKQGFSYCNITFHTETPRFSGPTSAVDREARAALQYLLDEVALDPMLNKEEQEEKVQEFQIFAAELSPEVAPLLISLLLEETHSRVTNLLQNAAIDDLEVNARLSEYENAVLGVENMTVEIARQMLFFVAELDIHRQYVYEFGVALECPETQLLRHDLSKLSAEQFEGYARFLRGGKQETDKQAFLTAWEYHQYEEHHLERYKKEGFSPVGVPDEYLRNNMRETVADLLAATKQRGGCTMIDWLVNALPEKNPHPRLLPFLEEVLIKAHALYLEAEENSDSDSIFRSFPCWNNEVEEVFSKLVVPPNKKIDAREELIHKNFSDGVFFTRADIVALTGLDKNDVSALLDHLIGYGCVIKVGHGHNMSYRLATTQEIEERQISIDEAVAQLCPISDVEQTIIEHPLWLKNVAYGIPRPGHPEGAIIFHIHDVLDNVESRYANSHYYEELRLIALIHDSFKGLVDRAKPKMDGNNHADYAVQFTHQLGLPSNIIEIIRYHDEVYFSQQSNDIERLHRLIDRVGADLDLYTAFFICDTETGDKDKSIIQWFQEQTRDYLEK